MASIIPISRQFDQQTMKHIIDADPVGQRYQAVFALLDWGTIDPLSLTVFGTIGTNVVVGTLVWVGTARFFLPFSAPAAAREEKREILGIPP